MKTILVTVLFMLSAAPLLPAQQQTGTVCVAARVDDPFWKEPRTLSNGQLNTHGLRFRVDRKPSMPWPDRKSLKIEELNLSVPHVLAVLDANGKPTESVRFKFSEYKTPNLCMFYDGYQGIGLDDATRHTPWCKCH